ncbi:MAG: MFS transporter [Thermodesulfobacteriota bacterium]
MPGLLPKSNNYRYVICALIFSGYVLVFFQRLCPAVLALDIQESFGAGGTLLGVLASAYFYPYALMQLPTGLLVDHWGPRYTVSFFFVIAALGALLMSYSDSLKIAVFGRVLVGLGVSTLFVSYFKLIAEWFPSRQFVILGGLFMAMGGVGALLASVPLAWISSLIGWRPTLAVIGLLTFVAAVLIFAFVRNRPADMELPPIQTEPATGPAPETPLWQGLKAVVTAGRFWPISIWSFFAPGIAFAVGGLWGGPFLMQVYGLSKPAAGGVLSTFALSLIFGGPLLGWAANRLGRKTVLTLCSSLLLFVCLALYLFMARLSPAWLYVLFFCIFLAGGAAGPIQAAVSRELFPAAVAGTAMGSVNLFPFLGGAFFQVLVGAFIAGGAGSTRTAVLGGYQKMFLIYSLGALISLAAACLMRETLCREADDADSGRQESARRLAGQS